MMMALSAQRDRQEHAMHTSKHSTVTAACHAADVSQLHNYDWGAHTPSALGDPSLSDAILLANSMHPFISNSADRVTEHYQRVHGCKRPRNSTEIIADVNFDEGKAQHQHREVSHPDQTPRHRVRFNRSKCPKLTARCPQRRE